MAARSCDVAIVGGGPAGTSAAALLAREGHEVLVFEHAHHPRFHIGESLLPCVLPLLKTLGLDTAAPWFLRKKGAEFCREETGHDAAFSFADALPGAAPHAYQVARAAFDLALAQQARSDGATVLEGVRVDQCEVRAEGCHLLANGEHVHARYVIDASGQDALFAQRSKSRRFLKGLGLSAVYRHYKGLTTPSSQELFASGNIRVLMVEEGWAWLIPLPGRELSVGLVSRNKGLDLASLEHFCANSPMLRGLIQGASASGAHRVRNFSFVNDNPAGSRWCCIGDAAAFLDPVFSSGVSLAMLGAQELVTALSPRLGACEEADPELSADMHTRMTHAYRVFGSLIRGFYQRDLVDNFLFHADPEPDLRAGLTSMLGGDVWRDDNRFQKLVLSSKRYRLDPFNQS